MQLGGDGFAELGEDPRGEVGVVAGIGGGEVADLVDPGEGELQRRSGGDLVGTDDGERGSGCGVLGDDVGQLAVQGLVVDASFAGHHSVGVA